MNLQQKIEQLIDSLIEGAEYDTDGMFSVDVADELEDRGHQVYLNGTITGTWHWVTGGEPDELYKEIDEYDIDITVEIQDNEIILKTYKIEKNVTI